MAEISLYSHLIFLKNIGVSIFLNDNPNNHYNPVSNNKSLPIINEITNVKDLKELEQFVKNLKNIDLKNNAKSTVMGSGNEEANIMIIGEAPGAEEDNLSKPFVGAAGQLLNKMLIAIKLNRGDTYITNVVPWRPPNNRTPTNEEILECLPFVQKQIEIIKPKIIVLLGLTAAKAILNTNLGISQLRGQWHSYKSINYNKSINCIVTYHPSFLLRTPSFKKESWEDLKNIQKRIIDEKL